MDLYTDLVGYLAGLLIVGSFIPQAVKTFKTKDVLGLSFTMYTLFNLGTIGWIVYGFIIHSRPVLIFNCITFVFSFPVWVMILKYRCQGINCDKP